MNPRSFWCAIILSDHFVFFIFFRPAAIILPIICIFIFFAQPSRSFAIISFLFIFSTGVLEAQNTGGLPKNTQIQLLAALHQFLPLPVSQTVPASDKNQQNSNHQTMRHWPLATRTCWYLVAKVRRFHWTRSPHHCLMFF